MNNGLTVCIDWLEFTVKTLNVFSDILCRMGLQSSLFSLSERGGLGYRTMYKHISENIRIYLNGNEDMGIHIVITGSAIHYALESFKDSLLSDTPWGRAYDVPDGVTLENLMPYYLQVISDMGTFTRIDLAIDDFGNTYFDTLDVIELMEEKRCVSKFRNWRNVFDSTVLNEKIGHTVYLGSRQSEVFLRIYDKALEQKVSDALWTRWELEIKGMKANIVAMQIIQRQDVGNVSVGILSNYMRFVNLDDSNRSRCSNYKVWDDFINGIEKIRLSVPKKEFDIGLKLDWIKRQVLPTIAGLSVANGGDMGFIYNGLSKHFDRLDIKTKNMFLKAGGYNDDGI